ncbi:hypothetical protein [Lusitaniella coriacea]|uniref:hypothetical protein n=1 Tax=Lusitaniella coriacea TaxID=1983105 RepID=UPI003CF32A5A
MDRNPRKKLIAGILIAFAATLASLSLLLGAIGYFWSEYLPAIPYQNSSANKIAQIEATFPLIESLQANYYHYQDSRSGGCKTLEYREGNYRYNPIDNFNCYLDVSFVRDYRDKETLTYQEFNEKSLADFEKIEKKMDSIGIDRFNANFDEQGNVISGSFGKICNFCRTVFNYEPNYRILPETIPHEMEFYRIGENQNWFREEVD